MSAWLLAQLSAGRLAAVGAISGVLLLVLLTRPAGIIIHQTNQIFVDSSRADGLWAEEVVQRPADAAEAGLADATPADLQLEPAATAAAAQGRPASGCGTKPAGAAPEPHPNECTWWQAMHEQHVADIQAADAGEGFELIFYGDSLTEMWHGTRANQAYGPRQALPGIFSEHFGQRWRTAAFGMSGDTAANLEWRLLHGELPQQRQPHVVVVLIGTNDLKDAKVARDASRQSRQALTAEQAISQAVPAVTRRIAAVLDLIQARLPDSRVLLMALLPRHKAGKAPPLAWPDMYTQGLMQLNENYLSYSEAHSGAVTFLDCGAPFFASPELLSISLLPDALHPSPEGAKLLADCMRKAIDDVMVVDSAAPSQ